MKIEIFTNVYFIPERLKEIDPNYFVLRDLERDAFEIHNSGQRDNTYCLTLPFSELDARALELIRKTQTKNMARLIAEMDLENEKLQNEKHKKIEDAGYVAKEILEYANHHQSKETVHDKAFTTRFI
jgi:hypothetical protein